MLIATAAAGAVTKRLHSLNGNSNRSLMLWESVSERKIGRSWQEQQTARCALTRLLAKNVISFVATCATDEVIETREGLVGIVDEVKLAGASDGVSGVSGVSADAPVAPAADMVDLVREKKSDRAKKEIMSCMREFHSSGCVDKATPGNFSFSGYERFRHIVRQTSFDGGKDVQLTGRKLAGDAEGLPSTRNITRDRAHAVRTNLRTPLAADERMKQIRWQLFDKPHSLAKQLQYSQRDRHVHMVCQQAVLNTDGEQGGGLKTVLKNILSRVSASSRRRCHHGASHAL